MTLQDEADAGLSVPIEENDVTGVEDQRPRRFSSTMVSKSS